MKKLKKVITEDSSCTYFSSHYNETYHSTSGAINESFHKYCGPCKVSELAKKGGLSILDVGFGLGYNVLAAIHTARGTNPHCILDIISLEKDMLSEERLATLDIPAEFKDEYKIVLEAARKRRYNSNGISVTIIEGDARSTIHEISILFDAVFFDPFSAKKNPEMWTVEFFREVRKRMTERATLATYSSAAAVRCAMIEADFKIGPGPGDNMKKGGTVATIKGEIEGLSEKELKRLEVSPERFYYHDPHLDWSREEIVAERQRRMSIK